MRNASRGDITEDKALTTTDIITQFLHFSVSFLLITLRIEKRRYHKHLTIAYLKPGKSHLCTHILGDCLFWWTNYKKKDITIKITLLKYTVWYLNVFQGVYQKLIVFIEPDMADLLNNNCILLNTRRNKRA